MTYREAQKIAKETGCFIGHFNFSKDESFHYYKGKMYTEDGAVFSMGATPAIAQYHPDDFYVKYTKDQIDIKIFENYHIIIYNKDTK